MHIVSVRDVIAMGDLAACVEDGHARINDTESLFYLDCDIITLGSATGEYDFLGIRSN